MSALPLTLTVNGQPHAREVRTDRLLLDFLRDDLGLTGTVAGCRNGLCGSCTVHLDGTAVRSCLLLAVQANGRAVRTIEGLAAGDALHPLQAAFVEHGAVQCGYCIPGMLMTAAALLDTQPAADERAIRDALEGNLCRCTGYAKIVQAVAHVAGALAAGAGARSTTPAPVSSAPEAPGASVVLTLSGAAPPTHGEPRPAVGRRLAKPDALEKVTGAADYVADLAVPGALHARLLRSMYPHARIVRLDATRAEAHPGVVAVLSVHNTTRQLYTDSDNDVLALAAEPIRDQVLFDEHVRYVGQPIAAVAATTDAAALEALALIDVEYDELPAVYTPDEALADGAPQLHAHAPGNVAARIAVERGDVDAGFAAADVVVSGTFRTSRQKHAQLEPHGCLAAYDASGKLTVWTPTQTPHPVRMKLAALFGLPESAVRVVNPHIGGAFGGGLGFVLEPYCAALAIATRRPVRLVLSRDEDFIGTSARHPMEMQVLAGFHADGTPAALEVRTVSNSGAYATQGRDVLGAHSGHFQRLYPFPAVRFEGLLVYTNASVAGAFRGYGGPQAYFALEQVLDETAERLGRDPLDFRLQLAVPPGAVDARNGRLIASHGLAECVARARAAIGWERRGQGREARGPLRRGLGGALVMWSSGTGCTPHTLDSSAAELRLNADGTAHLVTGVCDMGTGAKTALCQIAADTLGVPVETVAVSATDTDATPFDVGAHASRTLYVAGAAVQAAARDARQQLLTYAATLAEADAADLDLRGGVVEARGVPARPLALAEVTRHAYLHARQFIGTGHFSATNDPPFGAQLAEVEVDVESGVVRVVKVVAAHDVGRAINPTIVEGQIEGALQQGIGWALYEDFPIDPATGVPLATTFASYRMPGTTSMPAVETILVEAPGAAGPYGAKGVGEPGLVPTAAAIANAIYDAIGVRLRELPMTPERVLRALRAARAE
jgi:putative selenate reductase molybdopterin-binding subunit